MLRTEPLTIDLTSALTAPLVRIALNPGRSLIALQLPHSRAPRGSHLRATIDAGLIAVPCSIAKGGSKMFARVSLLIVVVVLSLAAPSLSYAGTCPASPLKASQTIWGFGALTPDRPATAMHPCGKEITCYGGKFPPNPTARRCYWH
jgi:hypothetical protein